MRIGEMSKAELDSKNESEKELQKKYLFVGNDYPDTPLQMFRKDSILLREPDLLLDPLAPRVTGEFFSQFSVNNRYHKWIIQMNAIDQTALRRHVYMHKIDCRSQPSCIGRYASSDDLQYSESLPVQYFSPIYSIQIKENFQNETAIKNDNLIITEKDGRLNELKQTDLNKREGIVTKLLSQIAEQTGLNWKISAKSNDNQQIHSSFDSSQVQFCDKSSIRKKKQKTLYKYKAPEVGYWMLENDRLSFPDGYVPNLTEKVYLANLAILRNPKITLDKNLAAKEFITTLNTILAPNQPKSTEEALRWLYKNTLRYLLIKYTNYKKQPHLKTEACIKILQERFFPGKPRYASLLKSSVPPRKNKFTTLFKASPTFKHEYMEYVNTMAEHDQYDYNIERYRDMFTLVAGAMKKNPQMLDRPILHHNNKRLCITAKEVRDIVKLMNDIAK